MNNKNVRTIASVMIVLLAILLIIIFINFNSREYNKPYIMHSSGDFIVPKPSGDNERIVKNEIASGETVIIELSGDNEIDIELVDSGDEIFEDSGENIEELTSGEKVSGETMSGDIIVKPTKPPKKPNNNLPPKQSSSEPSIISSRTETSNQEKQEVLTEIDDALKELLEAVGKVKTVDESKLDASLESEVEP